MVRTCHGQRDRRGPNSIERRKTVLDLTTSSSFARDASIIGVPFPLLFVTVSYCTAQAVLNTAVVHPCRDALVPMFFALGGFLVAGSLERNRLLSVFFGLRVLRFFPALATDVLLSSLIIGPALTTYTLSAYAADPRFSSYFLNVLGSVHFSLPGVFGNKSKSKSKWPVVDRACTT